TDITMTLVILGYTYIYNWVYDRARLYFVEA
ncbi:MAG: chlorhexidine efflux transporter, partial [Veillonella parvula]|nr:LysR family transcriptional regulator [Veillonella sp.]MDU6074459.1 chlorhexidine efflux transporter [Veillonella parvula]